MQPPGNPAEVTQAPDFCPQVQKVQIKTVVSDKSSLKGMFSYTNVIAIQDSVTPIYAKSESPSGCGICYFLQSVASCLPNPFLHPRWQMTKPHGLGTWS